MQSKVVVKADETTGSVINVSTKNSLYGFIKVEQVRTIIDDNGFLSAKPISGVVDPTVHVFCIAVAPPNVPDVSA